MRIALTEIWNFIDLIEKEEKGWSYTLKAGSVVVEGLSQSDLQTMKTDPAYDVELLPSLFTFREILWQPDIYSEKSQSLPPLRILKAYCLETIESFNEPENITHRVYSGLLKGIAKHTSITLKKLEKSSANNSVNSILGKLRTQLFPILKFFIYHPQNRIDHYRDAVNRLNFAVKIILTEYNGKYTDLSDPYWEVSYIKSTQSPEKQSD